MMVGYAKLLVGPAWTIDEQSNGVRNYIKITGVC